MIGISAAILIIISFYGGTQYQKSTPQSKGGFNAFQNFSTGSQNGGAARRGGMFGANGASGEIISKDNTSITIKLTTGGSKIVFFSSSTRISKLTDGSINDLIVGTQIMANGSPNKDGSVTAQTVQIHPQGTLQNTR